MTGSSCRKWLAVSLFLLGSAALSAADKLPVVRDVEAQPLQSQVTRVATALESLGQPLTAEQKKQLDAALAEPDGPKSVAAVQELFDPLCLVAVNINPESRVKVAQGPVRPQVVQHGWQVFLVKVHNEAGVTAKLNCTSPNAAPQFNRSTNVAEPANSISQQDVRHRWMDVAMFEREPLAPTLSGLKVEYRIVELYSRDAGQREGKLVFDVGQGTQDLGFRNEVNLLFECQPAVEVTLQVIDDDGKPTTGQFEIRDSRGRVYPAQSRRLAPDFFFHAQVYRHDGETILLPAGEYEVRYTRGPEYEIANRKITVPNSEKHREAFRLKRWIHLADLGWFSGDHHVHAAGCAHYESPTQGVSPEAMMRHIVGEDLNVGCVLAWGPCWYHQKEFFEGKVNALSQPHHLMRYDVEVSGFPSSHAGHLCLLRLKEDDYPGTTRIEEWPSWDLPVLQWGKQQGAVVGFSHSGWGLAVPDEKLPSYTMPPFDGIGANEYIVDVTHGAVDFISAVDTPLVWELSIWYHTLNCGYTTRISGETDFPCIYGERVGLGRSYVKLGKSGPLDFDAWVSGLRDGRSYVSDGLSHLMDFTVNDVAVGEAGDGGRLSVLAAKAGIALKIKARAAALLPELPQREIHNRPLKDKPYWHVERARVGDTRRVPVELVAGGVAVARTEIEANGQIHDIEFTYTPTQSNWLSLRILASSHTNPIFVELDGKPIRASKRSAQWCLDAVDVCWEKKSPRIREGAEREAARQAYEHARGAYRRILSETSAP